MKTSTTIAFAAALMATTAHAAPVAGINIGDYVASLARMLSTMSKNTVWPT